MTRSLLLLTTAAAAALAGPAFAESDPDRLDEVVVTATRLPAIVADTPGARIIDQADIEDRGAVFAADVLTDVPGLSVVRSGVHGVAQVRMRGAAPGKTLVLVDGMPVNDAAEVNGAYDFSGLDLAGIERIEVLSGPQSSLWGSDAIGGVIAFTNRETDGLDALIEAGSFDTRRGRIAVGAADDRRAIGAFVSRFSTDGISAADAVDGATERDGFDSTTVGLNGRHALSPAVEVDGRLRWNEAHAELDGYPAPAFILADTDDGQDSEQWSGLARLRLRGALGHDHAFSLGAYRIERTTQGDFPTAFEADRRILRWQADGARGEGLTWAFGAEREDVEGSLSTGLVEELGTTSAFGLLRLEATDRLTVTGGLRHDETDDFGGETTGRLSAALDLERGFILSGAVGTGFKAPTVSQAVCDYCFSASPFPALSPETADSVELALGWRSSDGRFDGRVTAYRLNVEDQITYVFDPASFESVYVNVAETRTDGIEAEARADLGGGFDLALAWAWTDAVDRTTGARLLRVPEQAASATLGWTGDRLSGALTVRAEGDQDDAGGVRDGFVTANLNAAWALTDAVSLTARIENLADERYQQVFGYGEPGRSAYLGLRLSY